MIRICVSLAAGTEFLNIMFESCFKLIVCFENGLLSNLEVFSVVKIFEIFKFVFQNI